MAILWWTALKRSLSCKSQGSCDVIKRDDDDSRGGSAMEFNHKKSSSSFRLQPSSSLPRSGCSRSISNLRDVIVHSARFQAPAPPAAARGKCDSPMSVESGHVLNPVTHDVLLATGSGRDLPVGAGPGLAAWDIGAVTPFAHSPFLMRSATATGGARLSQRKSPLRLGAGVYGDTGSPLPAWASCGEVAVPYNRCGGLFPNDSALESHHLVYHAANGASAHLPNFNLHSLKELNLLVFEMEADNLSNLYLFLKTFQCPNLERLFVQLPAYRGSIFRVKMMEEPPEDGLDNLVMVKVMNFNWCPSEVQLVSFLLRKARSLRKISIVSCYVTPVDSPGTSKADRSLLKEALVSGKIMLIESDSATTRLDHGAFIKGF